VESPPSLTDILPAIGSDTNQTSSDSTPKHERDFTAATSGYGGRFASLAPPLSVLKIMKQNSGQDGDWSDKNSHSSYTPSVSARSQKRTSQVVFHVIEEINDSERSSESVSKRTRSEERVSDFCSLQDEEEKKEVSPNFLQEEVPLRRRVTKDRSRMLKSSAPASGFHSAVHCDASSSSSTPHIPIAVRSLGNSIANTPKSTPRANELRQPIPMSALVDALVIIGSTDSQNNAEGESSVKLKISDDEMITFENEGWVMQRSMSNSNKSK